MRPYAIFLITLLLLHNMQLYMCRQVASKRLSIDASASTAAAAASMKRTISGAGAGQTEQLLQQQPGDQIESNYDEYPMVVPKRAALLLDRLMVALHHVLEKENSARQRIADLYTQNNNNNKYKAEKAQQHASILESNKDTSFDQGNSYNMYSDDDPSVLMDYDFKDLNSINRATGESLMTKGLQRRSQGLDVGAGSVGDKIANLGVARLTAAAVATAGDDLGGSVNSVGGAGRNAVANNGRLYWRCYFNAVSCF